MSLVTSATFFLGLGLSAPLIMSALGLFRRSLRTTQIPPTQERVLVLGASSGIGRSIAHAYAARGARVCVVGRREKELASVVGECEVRAREVGHITNGEKRVISAVADFTNAEDMVRVRDLVEREWRGLDTLHVVAGVSALQPLLSIAGLEPSGKGFVPSQASTEAIQRTIDVAGRATAGNFVGPLVAAVTLIPLLQTTSPSPSILLLSSLAAVIPAPTRALYAATKGSSLLLYQALSIEHPSITFSYVLPSTVEGNFRASAVDSTTVHEADPNKHGLKREVVADRCVQAVDRGDRMVFMPRVYGFAQFVYWLFPGFVEGRARAKYNFA